MKYLVAILFGLTLVSCRPQEDDFAVIRLPLCLHKSTDSTLYGVWQLTNLKFGGDSVTATLKCNTGRVGNN